MNRTIRLIGHSLGMSEHPDRSPTARSPHWRKFEQDLITERGECAATGIKTKLTGHHVIPFSLDRSRELDPENIILLTTEADGFGDFNIHLLLGHHGKWSAFSPTVVEDAKRFREWIVRRYATIQEAEAAGELPALFASDKPLKGRKK